jgi:hypothetical protein
MRAPLAILLCALSTSALALPAVPNLPGQRDICGIQIPPPRYALAKVPKVGIDGPHYVAAKQVARQCKDSGYQDAVGCTTSILLGKTVIAYKVLIASNPPPGRYPGCTPAKWRASILKHERAHMAGWGQNHPQ